MFKEEYYVSKRRKISLKEFDELYYKNKNFLDLQNLDLSGLNLSSYIIGKNVEYFYINNVNFEGTNITILLDTSSYNGINDSNLTGVKFITKNKMDTHFNNVILDNGTINQLNALIKYCFDDESSICDRFDLYTILNNQNLKLSFDAVMLALNNWSSKHQFLEILDVKKINELEQIINRVLSANETIRKFYEAVKDQLDYSDKAHLFFSGSLNRVTLKNITIDKDMWHFILSLNIEECILENVVLDFEAEEFNYAHKGIIVDTNVRNIIMPKLKPNDYDKISSPRLSETPITFRKNLYLELGRNCNAACSFCRNSCMNESDYNYEKIIKNLYTIIGSMDSIVIGGGEPTLKKKDLISLLETYRYYKDKFYIFSNGTKTIDFNQSIGWLGSSISYYISRHSVDDETNAHILGVSPNSISSIEDLLDMEYKKIILSCTCVNGGTDTPEKIIDYITKYKYNDVMFCNLMDDASVSKKIKHDDKLKISDDIFDEVISFLQKQGYNYSHEIISTAGYKLYILKGKHDEKRTIIFKKYITKKELDEKWPMAIKKTFDLSMAPDGSIYENWSQLEQKTKKKKR